MVLRLVARLRIFFVGLAIISCTLTGCQNSSSKTRYTFLVLPRTLANDFHFSLVEGVRTAALEQQVDLQIHPSVTEDDYVFQAQYLKELVGEGKADGVIITPAHSTKLVPLLRQLDRRGIPFIVVDTPLELPGEVVFKNYCGFIGTDNQRGGSLAADYVGRTLRKGKILLMRGVHTHRTSQDREIGFLKAIKSYPDIHIQHIVDGYWNSLDARKAVAALSGGELSGLDGVFAYNDLMALGAAEIFQRRGQRPLIVGYDGIVEVQSAIIAGNLDATVTQAPAMMGKRAVEKLKECIQRHTYPGDIELTPVTLLMATRTLTSVTSYERKK